MVRIGGSRAQRDLIDLTLVSACIEADRPEQASAWIGRGAHLPGLPAARGPAPFVAS